MAQITMQQVKELRDRTQAGLNDCRNALTEADGDMEKAVEGILKKGLAKSAKRAGAVAAEGVVAARLANDGLSGVIVEVNIQTDFAARNPDYLAFVDKVVDAAMAAEPGSELSLAPYPGGDGTVEDNRKALVGRLGENVTVRRWGKLSVSTGSVHSYIHMGGKVGALLALEGDARDPAVKTFAEDTAMHIAAMGPRYLAPSSVDAEDRAKQESIFDAQLEEEGKPAAVRPKILEGKINKWMQEICLLEQTSVVDSEKTIRQLQDALGGAKISAFLRYERGEGVDTGPKEDFAAEARKMAGG
jgi:elongation factor Ts